MASQRNRRAKRALNLAFDAMEDRVLLSAIIVPGTANPYLADPANDPKNPTNPALWKDGTAPPSINVTGGTLLTFSVTSGTNNDPSLPKHSPDGGVVVPAIYGSRGAVSAWNLPIDSLAGIFEGATLGQAPGPYTGSVSAKNLSPVLGQVFPIGDGLTGTGTGSIQVFHVPAGATKLYLANIDSYQWANNGGKFSVTATSIGYIPAQIRTAYGLPPISNIPASWSGAGQTIAIVGIGDNPNIVNDLAAFDKQFNLPPADFEKLNSSALPFAFPPTGSQKFQDEEAADVEWAHAIAPGAKIRLVETNDFTYTKLLIGVPDFFTGLASAATYLNASVVETSFDLYAEDLTFGVPVPDPINYPAITLWIKRSFDSIYLSHPGVTFVAASGDDGNIDAYPAISPNVISVGGTYLQLNSDNTYKSESHWNNSTTRENMNGGYGSSILESRPVYQANVQSTRYRAFPDVSFDASSDSAVVTYTSGEPQKWFSFFGTSLAAPCWAGLIAIANQQRVASPSIGKPFSSSVAALTALYSMPTRDFNQINGLRYNATTGLGSPKANYLIPDLAAWKG